MRLARLLLSLTTLILRTTAEGWSQPALEDRITFPVKFFASSDCSGTTSALGLDVSQLKTQIMYSNRLELKPMRNPADNTPSENQPWQIPGIPTGPNGDLLTWSSVMVSEGYYCEFKNGSDWKAYKRFGHHFVDDSDSKDLGKRCLAKSREIAEKGGMVDVYDFSSTLGYYVCHNGTGIREGRPMPP